MKTLFFLFATFFLLSGCASNLNVYESMPLGNNTRGNTSIHVNSSGDISSNVHLNGRL